MSIDLESVGKKYSVEQIDKCIKKVSTDLDIPYKTIYSSLKEKKPVKVNIQGIGEIPTRIKDANLINQDPDTYVKEHIKSTEELQKLVELASYLYYNMDGGGLTDNSFDSLQYILNKKLRTKGKYYEKIGAPPVPSIREQLPYPMPSLNKVRPGEMVLSKFLEQYKDLAWSLKLDGVSGLLVYSGKKLVRAYTRGDGNIGGNITELVGHMDNIPKSIDNDMVIRGEFIIPKRVWNEKYSESGYSNPRAFVSGKINAGHVSIGIQDVQFLAYSIISWGNKSVVPKPSVAFKLLTQNGFLVPENGSFFYPTLQQIADLYVGKRKTAEYNIDGIVLTQDTELQVTQGNAVNPTNSVAFKMMLEEQVRDTKVINIEWNISRYGRYVPVVIYEAVYIDGVRLHRATGHNAKHIRDWSMGKGTKIKIVRSGDVIPFIKEVDVNLDIEPIYPSSEYKWKWEKSDIVLVDIENNPQVHMARNLHFISTIGITGLGEKTVEYMYDAGLKTLQDIVNATPKELKNVKGIGNVKATRFYNDFKSVMTTTPVDRYLVAVTGFNSGLGRIMFKRLLSSIPDILEMSASDIQEYFRINKIPGFGKGRIDGLVKMIPEMRKFLFSINKEYITEALEYNKKRLLEIKKKGENTKIKGFKFVITGFINGLDYDLEDYIYNNGGEFLSAVTKDVKAVISANVSVSSKKILEATTLDIPVYTITEFVLRFDIDIAKFKNATDVEQEVQEIKNFILNPKCIDESRVELKKYQRDTVNWAINSGGLILAAGLGSGKTLIAVTFAKCMLDINPEYKVLVVTPVTLKNNFKTEMKNYGLDENDPRFTIISYESFKNIDCKSSILILDEAHVLRSHDSKIAKHIIACAKKCVRSLVITGTPIVNEPFDISNLVAIAKRVDPLTRFQFENINRDDQEFTNYYKCLFSFHEPDKKDFPQVIEENINLEMTPEVYEEYSKVENRIAEKYKDKDPWIFLTGLRKATNDIEPCQKCEWLLEFLKKKKTKTVVYIHFRFIVEKVSNMLTSNDISYTLVTGKIDENTRVKNMEKFNKDKNIQVLIISKVGGLGINLKNVRNVVFMDPSWNTSAENQIKARAIRYKSHESLPKKEQNVTIYYLVLSKPKTGSRTLPSSIYKSSADEMMKELAHRKEVENIKFMKRLEAISVENKCLSQLEL